MNEDQSPNSTIESQKIKPALEQLACSLLEKRLELGLTIERVAMATKISLPFIKALEEGKLQELPEPVFSRGFIRNICKLYDLADKDLLKLYEQALDSHKKMILDRDEEATMRRSRSSQHWRKQVPRYKNKKAMNFGSLKPIPFLVLATGVVVGITFSYYFITRNKVRLPVQTSSSLPSPRPEMTVKVANDKTAIIETSQDLKEDQENMDIKVEELVASEDGQIVEILVKTPVKIKFAKDGGEWINETLKPDSYQYRFQEELNLYIYDTEAVEVSYNGQKLGNLGSQGNFKKLSFKLRDDPALKHNF